MKLTLEDFEMLTGFIYRKTGIRFESKKMYFIEKRVEKRMSALGYEDPLSYIRFLRFIDTNGKELQELINLITVNESYFFRDFSQLQAFAEHSLQEVLELKSQQNNNTLKIWSAGCSTGEEPYTIAIILLEMIDQISNWNIEIIASDIDENVLNYSRKARYPYDKLKDVPLVYLEKYFSKLKDGDYRLSFKAKNMIQFKHLNLSDKNLMRRMNGFDFIFCRNVLIYFDDQSRKQIVDHFYAALNQHGYIFLGSSESVGRISTAFQIKRAGDYLVYYKE